MTATDGSHPSGEGPERRAGVQARADASLAEVVGVFDPLLGDLFRLASTAEDLWRAERPSSSQLVGLHPGISAMLADKGQLVIGGGVAVGLASLSDRTRHLEWRWQHGDRLASDLRVNLDPASPDFYDYTEEEWFRGMATSAGAYVAGPYVDYFCTNDYALTIAHPVLDSDRVVVAAAAADVPVASLEAYVLPLLVADGIPRVVTNGMGRVVLSSVASMVPGARIDADPSWPVSGAIPAGRPFAGWRVVECAV